MGNTLYGSSSTLAAALSLAGLSFRSHAIKAALLTLTPHHLYYLLSRIEELGIAVGPLSIRLENVISDESPTNYVSFLQVRQRTRSGRSDKDSIHSVSSVRSTLSSITTFWSSIGLGGSASSKSEKAKAAAELDLKYLYSAFTKLPSLRLTTDHRARLIRGYEEFPFDTAVPLFAFKNLQQLDIIDLDFRQFCGWDRLAEQLTLLTVKRANVEDPAELLVDIVLDDAEKRRRRSAKRGRQGSPTPTSSWTVPSTPRAEFEQSHSDLGSPSDELDLGGNSRTPAAGSPSKLGASPSKPQRLHQRSYPSRSRYPPQDMNSISSRPRLNSHPALSSYRKPSASTDGDLSSIGRPRSCGDELTREDSPLPSAPDTPAAGSVSPKATPLHDGADILVAGSGSPRRTKASRPTSSYRHIRAQSGYASYAGHVQRSGSGSSESSETFRRSESTSNLLDMSYTLPASKWQRLKYLSLADNGMTYIPARSLAPVASTLRSLNLSSNLFVEVPDALASLTRLVSVDLSNCMIESLQSLTRSPLPAITTLKLRGNRLKSLAGVERLLSLEKLDVQDNKLTDPTEAARLTGLPNFRRLWMKHNKLTKTYNDWRVTVFNLFRQTPGYVEDIIIDDSGPGFAERKHLVERVAEVEPRFPDTIVQIADPPVVGMRTEQPLQKAPRRRIVDLAQDDSPRRSLADPIVAARTSLESATGQRQGLKEEERRAARVEAAESKAEPTGRVRTVVEVPGDGQDDYKTKIEALRREFGSNWLSQLGDQAWHNDHHLEIQRGDALVHGGLHRPASTAIVSGARTLG
ncbi:hypothetical protein DV738_g3387, partial [Chaetothyriales sp. CBS 135597]